CMTICQRYGLDHPRVLGVVNTFGRFLQRVGKGAEAAQLLQETLTACKKRHGENHPRVAEALVVMEDVLAASTRFAERERLLRAALGMFRSSPEDGPAPGHARCLFRLGVVLLQQGRFAESKQASSEARDLLA